MQHKLTVKNFTFGSLRDQSLVIFPFGRMLSGHLVENHLKELVVLHLIVSSETEKIYLSCVVFTMSHINTLHTSFTWSKWNMGEIFGLKFHISYLH